MTPLERKAAEIMPSVWMVKPTTDVERHLRELSLEGARDELARLEGEPV